MAVATAAHEIPQEVGDFSIMLRSKMPRRQIITLQVISAMMTVPVALLAYFIGDILSSALPWLLSLVAGFMIYIALGEVRIIIKELKEAAPRGL